MFASGPGRPAYSGVEHGRRPGIALLAVSVAAAVACGLLGACSAGNSDEQIGVRRWGEIDVAVELRPSPPRAGSNEAVVIVSGAHHRPVYDAQVFVRARTDQPWVQAIEDGHVGVYRRAVHFAAGAGALQVRLLRGSEETVLEYPVVLAATVPGSR